MIYAPKYKITIYPIEILKIRDIFGFALTI